MDKDTREMLDLLQTQFDKLTPILESMTDKIIDLSERVSSLEARVRSYGQGNI